jgi:TonB family protein
VWFSQLKKYALPLTLALALLFCLVFQLKENTPKPSKGSDKSIVDVKGVDFAPYFADLERRVRPHWSPPIADRNKKVVVLLNIRRDGSLNSFKLLKKSGSASADAAALQAIKLSGSFSALPPNYPGHYVAIDFTFSDQLLCPESISTQKTNTEADLVSYINDLKHRIYRHWTPPLDHNRHIVAVFHITRNGNLQNLKLRESSGSTEADNAALEAVRMSAPFCKLPAGYKESTAPVEFTFEYQGINNYAKHTKPELTEAEAKVQNDSYVANLEQSVQRNWHPLSKDSDKRVVIIIYITNDGHLNGTRLVGESGSTSADAAAMKAIRLTIPFKQPPVGHYGNTGIELTFDKQLMSGGLSGRLL